MRHFRCPSCGGVNRIPDAKVDASPRCGRCQTPLDTSGAALHLGDTELQALIDRSPVPVLVDFYADWCAPCRTLGPVLEALGKRHAGRLFVAKIDTERHQQLAGKLGVRGIPAVFLFKGGELVAEETGAHPAPHWEQLVAPHLA